MHTENDKEKEYVKELEGIQFPLHMELTSDLPKRKYKRSFTTRIGPTRLKSKVINKSGKWIIVTEIVEPLNLWSVTARFIGVAIAVYFFGDSGWPTRFRVSSLVMGHAYLGLLSGIFWYYPEERPKGSPLITIYRVFKAAFRKRGLAYPSSAEGYSSNRNIEASNDSENPFYTREDCPSNGNNEGRNDLEDPFYRRENDHEVHLKPRDPSFLVCLDKAAIISEGQEEACTVEQVRDVKSLFFIIPLGLTFFAYSLVSASGNIYFVKQTTNLDSKVGNFDVPDIIFFVLKYLVASVVPKIESRKEVVGPIWSMAVGMFCSVLCCISAGVVERYRLSMAIEKDPDKDVIPLSIMILTPQFVLQGLMEGFGKHGLKIFVLDRVPASMRKFVEPGIEMLLGIGKLSSILFTFVFHWWVKDSINHSHLDWYFLMLASLSFVFFVIYVCYAKFELPKLPEFEGPDTDEGNVGRMREIEIEVVES